jgi:hypothetical protein
MILLCASSTNCLPQTLHLWLCLPLWMWPFLTVCSDVQRGQDGVSVFIFHANNLSCYYLLGTTQTFSSRRKKCFPIPPSCDTLLPPAQRFRPASRRRRSAPRCTKAPSYCPLSDRRSLGRFTIVRLNLVPGSRSTLQTSAFPFSTKHPAKPREWTLGLFGLGSINRQRQR